MSDSCNSRHFSWLMKSCLPDPHDAKSLTAVHQPTSAAPAVSPIGSLPDDLLLECLSKVPSSSIPSAASVCCRWSRLLHSPHYFRLRRRNHLLHHSLIAVSSTDSGIFVASLPFVYDGANSWNVSLATPGGPFCLDNVPQGGLSHARAAAIGPRVYLVAKNAVLRYDCWTGTVISRSPMIFPRKKFAMAVCSRRIYVAGGGGGGSDVAASVEEYDPERNRWRVIAQAPRKRYGCIGAAVDGVFYVIGGLKIGNDNSRTATGAVSGTEGVHVYASSMDLYDTEARQWLRSSTVPGGGCVVAACATGGYVYVLSSHAVEVSFWRLDARRRGGANGGSGGFGEWSRLKSPPLPAQVRLDGTVRFGCMGLSDKVAMVQVVGCIDDLLRRSGRNERGMRDGLVLIFDTVAGEWSRAPDLPEVIQRAACASVEC